jgi:plasmid stability protein
MAHLLIRDVEPAVIKQLKLRAKQHHRSLQGELKFIVTAAATTLSMSEASQLSKTWHLRLKKNVFSDSTKQIREDRER